MEQRAAAERRIVTALFLDVVGSTASLGAIGPERMKQVLDLAFTQLRDIVAAQGGTIEKYVGDAIFALFGAPTAHEDDAVRALRAAEGCARWSRDGAARGVPAVRIGVETGEALVDLRAIEHDRQRMAVGTCINVAARLQAQADPGQVLVGPLCHEATERRAELRPLGDLALNGIGPTPAWELVHVGATELRPRLRFVGRGDELERLAAARRSADGGHARLVLVVGPPGQGKSRLVDEFLNAAAPDRLLVARCRPDTELGASHPLRQLLESDIDAPTESALEARLRSLGCEPGEASRTADAIAHSAGLSVSERLLLLPAGDRTGEIIGAWRRFMAPPPGARATIVWVDDLHWAEPALVRLIDLLGSGQGTGPLVIATVRPEMVDSAGLRPTHERISLEPLPPPDALMLAREASSSAAAWVERAEGNPLFIIELARSRSGSADLPLTVQAAIAARVDELPPDDRELLQRAAIAGETFSVRDAAVLTERAPADLAGALARLTHLQYLRGVGADFRFHHALVRDVAYGRVPMAERMRLHARFAQEGVPPEDAEALAHHWWSALRPPDADWVWAQTPEVEGYRREAGRAHLAAARMASDRFASDRAIELLERARVFASGPADRALIEQALGTTYHRETKGDDAWLHRRRAIEAFRESGVAPPAGLYADMLELPAFNPGYAATQPPLAEVHRLLDEGERVARAERDLAALALLLTEQVMFGESSSAGETSDHDPERLAEAASIAVSADNPAFAGAVARLGQAYLLGVQDYARAEAMYVHAEALHSRGGQVNEPEMLLFRGRCALDRAELTQAEKLAARLIEIAERRSPHTQSHALGLLASIALARGDRERASRAARDLDRLAAENPSASWCLVGASAAVSHPVQELAVGRVAGTGVDALLDRMLSHNPRERAGVAVLVDVMRGRPDVTGAIWGWTFEGIRRDRNDWAFFGHHLVIGLVMLERWPALAGPLARLRADASRGARLAGALADAVEEEAAASGGGPAPSHSGLREIGAVGYSELLRYRVGTQTVAGS
jgi:class 3 adenylate cyclase/tetratricopeptide (TPR) repeat protein